MALPSSNITLIPVSTPSVTVDFSSWLSAVLVTLVFPRISMKEVFSGDAQLNTWAFQFLDLSTSVHFFLPLLGDQFLQTHTPFPCSA